MQTIEITKEIKILHWCRVKKVFSSVEARQWGLDNHYTRADRTVRDFVTELKLRRLLEEEILLKGLRKMGNAPIAWYAFLSM